MTIYYVYVYLRSRNSTIASKGSPYYIGKGSNGRAYSKHGSLTLPKDKNNIVFLETNLSENKAFEIEKFLIAYHGRKDLGTGILMNKTDGGEGPSGAIRSDETRKKMSDSAKGKTHSLETRKKMSIAAKGKVISEETRKKLSETNMGKPFSEEHRKRMSDSRKGKTHSDVAKEKMSLAKLNMPIIECPHCGKSGKGSNMTRYHFDNCRSFPA